MPLQNRVTPFGEPIAVPARGTLMGNRGHLPNDGRRIRRAFVGERRWICCVTDFKDRRLELMGPVRTTQLFFLDEATALAAGHRPCHECRRADALRFRAAWARAAGVDEAILLSELDRALDADRRSARGEMRRWTTNGDSLPEGAMVDIDGSAHLVAAGACRPWSPGGYGAPRALPAEVRVLTPCSIVGAIAAGYAVPVAA